MTDDITILEKGTFDARYETLEEIGNGGQGFVYKVLDKETQEIKAAKLIRLSAREDFDKLQRLEKEAVSLRGFYHPNIPALYDSSFERVRGGSLEHFLVMEYIDGPTLEDEIGKRRFDEGEVRGVAEKLYDALKTVYEKGIIHRDVKPSNIMLEKSEDGGLGRVVLTDFGVAKHLGKDTRTASVGAGTVYYMSPEQYLREEVSHESDVYSLTLVLLDMLQGETRSDHVINDKPLEALEKLAHLSPGFAYHMKLALSHNVGDRREGIEGIVNGSGVAGGSGEIEVTRDSGEVEVAGNKEYEFNRTFTKLGVLSGVSWGMAGAIYPLAKGGAPLPIVAIGAVALGAFGAFGGGALGYNLDRVVGWTKARLPWGKTRVVELDKTGNEILKELYLVRPQPILNALEKNGLLPVGYQNYGRLPTQSLSEMAHALVNYGVDKGERKKYKIENSQAVVIRKMMLDRLVEDESKHELIYRSALYDLELTVKNHAQRILETEGIDTTRFVVRSQEKRGLVARVFGAAKQMMPGRRRTQPQLEQGIDDTEGEHFERKDGFFTRVKDSIADYIGPMYPVHRTVGLDTKQERMLRRVMRHYGGVDNAVSWINKVGKAGLARSAPIFLNFGVDEKERLQKYEISHDDALTVRKAMVAQLEKYDRDDFTEWLIQSALNDPDTEEIYGDRYALPELSGGDTGLDEVRERLWAKLGNEGFEKMFGSAEFPALDEAQRLTQKALAKLRAQRERIHDGKAKIPAREEPLPSGPDWVEE